MITSRKNISRTVLLITLTIVVLAYNGIYSINSEDVNIYSKEINIGEYTKDVNNLTINGNNNQAVILQKGYAVHLPSGIQQTTNTNANANAKKSLNLENIAQFSN
jgi:hypothetical protein